MTAPEKRITLSEHDACLVVTVLDSLVLGINKDLASFTGAATNTSLLWTGAEAIALRNRLDLELNIKRPEPKKGAAS